MTDPANAVEQAFSLIVGQPCWDVRCGYGSFLRLHWGKPRLEIYEPRPDARWKSQRRRNVFIRGDWELVMEMCDWWVFEKGKRIASSHTRLTVQPAIQLLDGQKLTQITVNHLPGRSVFSFDLDTELHTRPYVRPQAQTDDQWNLFEPTGDVLSLRGDGAYSHQPGNTVRGEGKYVSREEWGGVPGKYRLPPGVTLQEGRQRL